MKNKIDKSPATKTNTRI